MGVRPKTIVEFAAKMISRDCEAYLRSASRTCFTTASTGWQRRALAGMPLAVSIDVLDDQAVVEGA
jgi:hypothetical protein